MREAMITTGLTLSNHLESGKLFHILGNSFHSLGNSFHPFFSFQISKFDKTNVVTEAYINREIWHKTCPSYNPVMSLQILVMQNLPPGLMRSGGSFYKEGRVAKGWMVDKWLSVLVGTGYRFYHSFYGNNLLAVSPSYVELHRGRILGFIDQNSVPGCFL